MRRRQSEPVQDRLFSEDVRFAEMRSELEATGRFRVLEKLQAPKTFSPDVAPVGDLKVGLFIDVETTGMNAAEDRIIQFGGVAFHYDEAGNVHTKLDEVDEFEDPGRPIPIEITELTGVTDDHVRGKVIDEERVLRLLEDAEVVIAHNASFDRPFVERRFAAFEGRRWACSMVDVDWRSEGFGSSKLEWLAYRYGYFFDSHRASDDCLAGVRLLASQLPRTGRTAMAKLLESAARPYVRLWAAGSPFDSKDALRRRGYRWQAEAKVWWRDLSEDVHEAELEWLMANVYGGRARQLPALRFDSHQRYSSRLPSNPPR